MLRRFGAWMYRYAVAIELAILVAGVLALVLNADGGFRGIEMAYWKSQAQACGLLSEYADGLRRGSYGDPQAATTCFMQAYAHCHAATLVESFTGTDTRETYTFAIEPVLIVGGGHPCSIQLNLTLGVIFANRRSHNDWVTCAGVDQRPDGLLVSGCGQFGTILVSTESRSASHRLVRPAQTLLRPLTAG